MASWEEIALAARQRKQALREFCQIWGAQPFFGYDKRGHPIAVTRELAPNRAGLGWWRVTWFFDEGGAPVPGGHTEARTFREALRIAVAEYGLRLETAEHLPTSRRRARRSERA